MQQNRENSKVSSRKDIILREAAKLFREKGYSGTTLRELARNSGVQGGSIYHHFSSKQEILCQIMECTMDNLITSVTDIINKEADPSEKLRKAVRFHIEFHTTDTNETFVTDSELRSLDTVNYEKIVGMRDRYEQVYIQIMKDGVSSGKMKIDDVKLTAMALLQMCTGVSYWFNPNGSLEITEIADKYIDLLLWGITGNKKITSHA